MRRLQLLLSLSFLLTVTATAGTVSQEEAQQRAAQFVQQKYGISAQQLHRATTQLTNTPVGTSGNYYVFNIGSSQGFVIVSGDDRTEPILGYSDSGTFDPAAIPDNMRAFLQHYDAVMARLQQSPAASVSFPQHAPAHESIWLHTPTYNQTAPYSNECPELAYSGHRSHAVTGCVATAMAEVMAFHKHPKQTRKEILTYSFQFQGEKIQVPSVPEGTVIDWANIKSDYEQEYTGTPEEDAVARLMAYCGQSVGMQYGVNETGGSTAQPADAVAALVDYFDYEETTTRYVQRKDYSYNEWFELLYSELKAGRPIIYSGQSASNAHAFVVEGYNNEDSKFYINWGWGGNSNGYFSLLLLAPESIGIGGGADNTGYSMAQGAIIGIQPGDGTVKPHANVVTLDFLYVKDNVTSLTRDSEEADFPAMRLAYGVTNYTGIQRNIDAGFRILDSEGKTVKDIMDAKMQNYKLYTNGHYRTDNGGQDQSVPVTIGADLPEGDYQLIAVSRETGHGEMEPDENADTRNIRFSIYKNQLSITKTYPEPVFGLEVEGNVTIKPYTEGMSMANKPHLASFTLRNKGTDYRGDLYYTVNEADPDNQNKQVFCARFIDLATDGTSDYTFQFKPDREGENVLRIYAYDQYKVWHLLATASISLIGAPDMKVYTTEVANFDTEQDAVVGNTFTIKLKVANEGSSTYSNTYYVFLSYSDDEGYSWINKQYGYPNAWTAFSSWQVTVAPGASVERQFTWNGLRYDRYHRVYLEDFNGESLLTEYYRLVEHTGIVELTADSTDDGKPVYNLQGIRVTPGKQPLSPGIYLKNGKKYTVK